MRWYEGSIAEAVTLSKQKNAIFVVFVEGQNDFSTEMAAAIDGEEVLPRLSNQDNFLAVKLQSGTPNYTHFAQLYQLVPVPSLFFIGRNGTPLEVVCAGVEPSDLAARVDRILTQYNKDKEISQPLSVQPSTSFQHAKEETANFLQSETQRTQDSSVAKSAEEKRSNEAAGLEDNGSASKIQKTEYEIVCDGDVCVRRAKSSDGAGPSQSSSLPSQTTSLPSQAASVSDQVASKPSQSNSLMEVEAGEMGDVVSETSIDIRLDSQSNQFNRVQEEVVARVDVTQNAESQSALEADRVERARQVIEARKREEAEKEKELERQRELERRTTGQGVAELKRWQAEQELKQLQEERKREKLENDLARQRILEQIAQDRAERRAREEPTVPSTTPAPAATLAPALGDALDSSLARVSLKLPDGSSLTVQFPADTKLAELTRYVSGNLHMSPSSFSLWTAFPRRELTCPDSSLRSLQLAPSAAVLVQPRAHVATPRAWTSLVLFVSQLFSSLIMEPVNQIYTWLASRLRPDGPSAPSPPRNAPSPPRSAPTTRGAYRRKGTVHRLSGDKDNDDNNTWNGNSTQQM